MGPRLWKLALLTPPSGCLVIVGVQNQPHDSISGQPHETVFEGLQGQRKKGQLAVLLDRLSPDFARQPIVEIDVLKQLQSGRDRPRSIWRCEVHQPLLLHHSHHQLLLCMPAQLSTPPHVLSSTPRCTPGRYFRLSAYRRARLNTPYLQSQPRLLLP